MTTQKQTFRAWIMHKHKMTIWFSDVPCDVSLNDSACCWLHEQEWKDKNGKRAFGIQIK